MYPGDETFVINCLVVEVSNIEDKRRKAESAATALDKWEDEMKKLMRALLTKRIAREDDETRFVAECSSESRFADCEITTRLPRPH